VGIGGEYPLSASITSESSQSQDVVKNLAMVFSMQGIGTILCSLVLVTVTNTLGDDYDTQWRLALGLGAVPMACSFYFRWKMHETSWANEINQPVLFLTLSIMHEFNFHRTAASASGLHKRRIFS